MSVYQNGPNSLAVPMKLFKENRERVVCQLRKLSNVPENSYILLKGGSEISQYDTDVHYVFRQVSSSNS